MFIVFVYIDKEKSLMVSTAHIPYCHLSKLIAVGLGAYHNYVPCINIFDSILFIHTLTQ